MAGLILIHLSILLIDIIEDWYKITKLQRDIKHRLSAGLVALSIIFTTFGFALWNYKINGIHPEAYWPHVAAWLALIPGFRWILHDYLLNWLRGKTSEHLDTIGPSALSDQLLIKIYKRLDIPPRIFRILFLIFSLILSGSILIFT